MPPVPSETRRGRLLGWLGNSLRFLLLMALIVGGLELASRAVHGFARPMMPFVTDAAGAPRLPANRDIDIRLPGMDRARIVTGASGERRPPEMEDAPAILLVGDSQMIGWGFDYEDTLGARLSRHLYGRSDKAVTLASAGADPESLRGWARDYTKARNSAPPKLKLIGLNLGNDLDEMFLGRAVAKAPGLTHGLAEFLSVHSYLFMDIALIGERFSGDTVGIPPGVNPTLFLLDADERARLSSSAASAIADLDRSLPAAERTVILLFPNDTQVDPAEMTKYRTAYPDEATYAQWLARTGEAKSRLDAIADRLMQDLNARGYLVVDVRPILQGQDATTMFDRNSHHLTPEALELLAARIKGLLSE